MAETSSFKQFLILLYKGLLLRKRHYIVTFFEIVIPVFIASIFPMIMSESNASAPKFNYYEGTSQNSPQFRVTTKIYPPFSPYNWSSLGSINFIYTPTNDMIDNFMNESVTRLLSNSRNWRRINILPAHSEKELETYSLYNQDDSVTIIGTVFNNFDSSLNELPESLDYKIRYGQAGYFGYNFYTNQKYRVNGPNDFNSYRATPFLPWQTAIEETFIENKMNQSGKNLDYKVFMQTFPYPDVKSPEEQFGIINLVPMVIGFGYLIFMLNILRRVIEEKSNGSKELMKMMGMTDSVYWSSTFLNYFVVGFITVLIITIIYKAPLRLSYVFLEKSNFLLILIMLLLYIVCIILFCMAFSIFFNRAVLAIIAFIVIFVVSLIVLMQSYFVINKINENYALLPASQKFGICLIPPGSLLTIFLLVSFYEQIGEGLQWSNVTNYDVTPDLNALLIIIAMLVSCLLYIIIIWYFDKVWPWQPGVPQPFYFMFTKSYWCGLKPIKKYDDELIKETQLNNDFFEEETSGATPGVSIQNLSKEFQVGLQKKLAVNNVSLNIYKGQITALLGHNGAGKTTTINILTGLYPPSNGTATINGIDILADTISARRGIGVCPQHNVLFDTLTVEEHLKIFAGLKGVKWSELTVEALKILELLKLTVKRNELVKNLSGGMKRKLCLGNAIVGGSKVLFLDEPTSGMDVEARRSVWDTLLDIRLNCTIILTTHYMEEADILGDRIAIMAEGEIQCCGSPIFLKRKFGTGYHLHIVKGPQFNSVGTTGLLRKYIPEISVVRELENEISYNLTLNSTSTFGDMFEELEIHKSNLGINSCGITVTTMEDVFLNVANISDIKHTTKGERSLQNGVSMEYEDVYGDSKNLKEQNIRDQFLALIEKRFHYTKRHWSILISQIALPIMLLCLCLFIIQSTQNSFRAIYDPLKLDINSVYGHTEGVLVSNKNDKLSGEINKVLQENNVKVQKLGNNSDATSYILNYGKNDLTKYLKTLLVGEGIEKFADGKNNLTAWYNGAPYHTMPMSLTLMHTSILRYVSSSKATITLTNAPLPKIIPQYGGMFIGMTESILASVFLPQALSFVSASFILLPIHERVSKAKHLQLMTGLHPALYWMAMFLWDYVIYFIISIILIIPFAAFFKLVFFGIHANAIQTALLLFWLYGFASIPLSYLISFLFKKGNTGFSVVVAICSVFGVGVASTFRSIKNVVPDSAVMEFLTWVFSIIPAFSVSTGFSKVFYIAFNNAYCDVVPPEDLNITCSLPSVKYNNPLFMCCKDICGTECLNQTSFITWDENACGRDVFFLVLSGIIFTSLLIFAETSYFHSLTRYLKQRILKARNSMIANVVESTSANDSDVINEEQRVRNIQDSHANLGNEALMVLDLTKVFRNFYAVDHLTFAIHQEECFGLLGVNGAGKTTTFRMLTGDCHPSEGNAFTSESTLIPDTKKFQSYLGYCPQFDALIDRLTGRETLTLFARLRGLSGSELHDRVHQLIKMTDLLAHADKQTQFYSGGNKRKLSVGMALIGSPPLILLDEPTAGVDPVSRRKIWNILAQARNFTKAAIILTTHSMEESEALCSRLAIMVNGKFKCLGSIQQLKSKFGQGYTLVIKTQKETAENPQAISEIRTFIESKIRGAELKDDHQGMLQYHITDTSVSLSLLFKIMAEMKNKFNLEDYLISDTSLEQIFLTFARAQRVVSS